MNYTKEEAKNEAIKRAKGKTEIGKVVAHESYQYTVTLKAFDGDEAVTETVGGNEMRFPKSEIFDPNKVVNIANHLLNLGFWKEGMESMMISL